MECKVRDYPFRLPFRDTTKNKTTTKTNAGSYIFLSSKQAYVPVLPSYLLNGVVHAHMCTETQNALVAVPTPRSRRKSGTVAHSMRF